MLLIDGGLKRTVTSALSPKAVIRFCPLSGAWGDFGATDVGRIRPNVLIWNGGQGRNRTTDTLYLADKITFAQVESAVSQQVVGSGYMKIEIRQHKAQQIALAGEIDGVTPEL